MHGACVIWRKLQTHGTPKEHTRQGTSTVVLKRARLLCYLVLCVSRAVLSVVLGAWSVRFVGWADWVDCRGFLSFVFLGVARRLELSPCNTVELDRSRETERC